MRSLGRVVSATGEWLYDGTHDVSTVLAGVPGAREVVDRLKRRGWTTSTSISHHSSMESTRWAVTRPQGAIRSVTPLWCRLGLRRAECRAQPLGTKEMDIVALPVRLSFRGNARGRAFAFQRPALKRVDVIHHFVHTGHPRHCAPDLVRDRGVVQLHVQRTPRLWSGIVAECRRRRR